MKLLRNPFLGLIILILSIFSRATAQNNDSRIIENLNKKIIPIAAFQPDSSFGDISFLKETLMEKHITGLGEALHIIES